MQAQVQRVTEHRYGDLVCREDYFRPVGGILPAKELAEIREHTKSPITEGELVVSLTPELHLVGDFVTRSMFRRITTWMDCLTEYRRLVYQAVRAVRRHTESLLNAEQEAWESLVAADAALRKACLTGRSAQVRDSCIILTQTYAAFHPAPELDWLGLPRPLIARATSLLRYAIESQRSLEAIDQISAAVHALRALRETEGSLVEAAIQTGGLVLVRQPPAAYWEKTEIEAEWDTNSKPFMLLWTLAEKAMSGRLVQDTDIWDEPGAKNRLAMVKGRLQGLLKKKPSLSMLISSVPKEGIRLTLDRRQIHLLATPSG
jgi:hypothetical protein